jgi:hypothetical protein
LSPLFAVLKNKKESSFSEEKEAKRLLVLRWLGLSFYPSIWVLASACSWPFARSSQAADERPTPQQHQKQKSFCFFFFRKRRILSLSRKRSSPAPPPDIDGKQRGRTARRQGELAPLFPIFSLYTGTCGDGWAGCPGQTTGWSAAANVAWIRIWRAPKP